MKRIILLNPNTSAAATETMCAIAREAAPDAAIDGRTAARGATTIGDDAALAVAAGEVARMAAGAGEADGVIVAAFGDPGLAAARAAIAIPVVGLAEAALAEAAAHGRFAIATTTPCLDAALRRRVAECGVTGSFVGNYFTRSGLAAMPDPARLLAELRAACDRAVADGAEAVVIGGGPLAAAARALRPHLRAALIEPVPAAVRAVLSWTGAARTPTSPP